MNNRHKTIKNLVTEAILLEKKKKARFARRIGQQIFSTAIEKPIAKLIHNVFDTDTVYGMGGNQPVVGEYSGPQSQRL